MKRNWWLAIPLLAVIPWLLIRSGEKPEMAASPGAPEPVRNGGSGNQVPVPAETGSDEAKVNERLRPSQRPEPRIYAKPKPEEFPIAVVVEGKPGYVISPYNGKIINLREIPAGTLVADPTFPSEEKKYFRVP